MFCGRFCGLFDKKGIFLNAKFAPAALFARSKDFPNLLGRLQEYAVIARSAATKQSRRRRRFLDCFASLAMTGKARIIAP